MKNYYILRDLDGYGSVQPVCVTRGEAERLCREWQDGRGETPDFDEIWREADRDDIMKYGTED